MIPHAEKLFLITLAALILLTPAVPHGIAGEPVYGTVSRVVDGDTIIMSGGERVRLLGIDAPERGEPFWISATDRLRELISPGEVTLDICERRDVYGRQLATVRSSGMDVNTVLLQEGLALPMLIPPCGNPVVKDVLHGAAKGTLSGKGIYSRDPFRIISHNDAGDHIGERAVVRGKVLELHRGPKAWHLNFGEDYRVDFTAVLFREGQRRFNELGLDPAGLVGTEVLVIGKLKRYNGPEIIVRRPEQILPLNDISVQNPKSKIQKERPEN